MINRDIFRGKADCEGILPQDTAFLAYDKNFNIKNGHITLRSGAPAKTIYTYEGTVSTSYDLAQVKSQVCNAIKNYLSVNGVQDFDDKACAAYTKLILHIDDLKVNINKIERHYECKSGHLYLKSDKQTVFNAPSKQK